MLCLSHPPFGYLVLLILFLLPLCRDFRLRGIVRGPRNVVCFLLIDAIQIDHPWKHSLLSISFNTVYECFRVLVSLSCYVNQLYGACANESGCGAVARLEEGKVNPGRGVLAWKLEEEGVSLRSLAPGAAGVETYRAYSAVGRDPGSAPAGF